MSSAAVGSTRPATATTISTAAMSGEPSHGPGGTELVEQPGTGSGAEPSGDGWHGAARAAVARGLQARRSAGRGTAWSSWLAPLRLNGNRVRLGAHVVAVGVVVGAGLAEVGERADHVGRVLAQVVELVLGVVHLAGSGCGNAVAAIRARAGVACGQRGQVAGAGRVVDQVVELRRRSGSPRRCSCCSAAANCGSCRTAGLDAATSGSSASSVVAARRTWWSAACSVPGSSASACSSAWLWRAIAPVAVLVLEISWVSCSLLEASACSALRALGPELVERGLVAGQLGGDLAGALQARREVLERPVGRLPLPCERRAPRPRMRLSAPRRVSGSSVSKSWSRLTSE